MSTLAVIATSALTGVIGAAAMYVPARLARHDARTYNQLAEQKLDECEQRDAAYEQARTLQPFWSFDAPELPAADPHVTGEVLHVEPHETGEHPVVEPEHKPNCPDLYYCPTVDEVESGCHGGFDVCCAAPELHVPVDDEDAPADDTDRPGLHLVLLAIPVALWDRLREWWQSLWAKPEPYRGRHWVQGTVHTGTFPIVVPAQRDGGDDRG